jgi:anti-sigma B factor antagonist
MSVNIETNGDTLRVRGLTELAAMNADEFKAQVLAAMSDDLRYIEGDMSGLEFIDSRGLGALIALQRVCRSRNGRLRLLNPSYPMEQVIRIAQLGRLFEVVREWAPTRHDQGGVRLSQGWESDAGFRRPDSSIIGSRRFGPTRCNNES